MKSHVRLDCVLNCIEFFLKFIKYLLTVSLTKPSCTHLYNLFHPTDPSVVRIEPLLSARFSHIPPVNVARYQKYPLGDGQPIHLREFYFEFERLNKSFKIF
jgi:hypothetical protein